MQNPTDADPQMQTPLDADASWMKIPLDAEPGHVSCMLGSQSACEQNDLQTGVKHSEQDIEGI